LKKLEIFFAETPLQQQGDGSWRRANTFDTIKEWLKHKPLPGDCLVFSNQPYVGYQHAVVSSTLPKTFLVETVGREAPITEKVVVFFRLARSVVVSAKPFN